MEEYYFSKNLDNLLLLTKKNFSFDKNLNGDFSLKKNVIFKDKNEYIFIGCQILKKNLFKNYRVENFSISEIWNDLLHNEKLNGFQSERNFYHLTNIEIFKKLQDF